MEKTDAEVKSLQNILWTQQLYTGNDSILEMQ